MREQHDTGPQDREANFCCVVEYLDSTRLRRIRDCRNLGTRLRFLEGTFFRRQFQFDFYTRDLEGKLVAFVGGSDGIPTLVLGLTSRLIHPEEHILYPVTHGSSCTGDMVWSLADHLRRTDLIPKYDHVPPTREEVHQSALYGLGTLGGRSRGPAERRVILGEEICYQERERWPGSRRHEAPGLIAYPILVLRILRGSDPRKVVLVSGGIDLPGISGID